jgi:MFS family permease
MMVPVGRLTVISSIAKSQLLRVMSFLAWPGLVAPVIAPLVGGLITTYASWRWIFLINVPLGMLAFAFAWRLIESVPGPRPPRLDRLGVILTCSGLALLTYTAHLVSEPATPWTAVGLVTGAATLALAAAVWHLHRSPAPLVNLRTLRIPTFAASIRGSAVFWLCVGSVPFLLPLLFQTVFEWSPVKSGAVVLFLFAGNVGIKPTTTFLLNRFGFRRVLIATVAGVAATLVASGFLSASTPIVVIALVVMLGGAARSVGLTCYSTMAFSDVPSEQIRDANTLVATNQQLAAGLGIAVATVLLRIGGSLSGAHPAHTASHVPFTIAFILLALVALIPLAGALRLHPTAGDELRHVTRRPSPAVAAGAGPRSPV